MVLYDTRVRSYLGRRLQQDKPEIIGRALDRVKSDSDAGGLAPRVIFCGEEHAHPLHHLMQLDVVKAVDALDDAPLAIGLEMFYRQHQPALDDYGERAPPSTAWLACPPACF